MGEIPLLIALTQVVAHMYFMLPHITVAGINICCPKNLNAILAIYNLLLITNHCCILTRYECRILKDFKMQVEKNKNQGNLNNTQVISVLISQLNESLNLARRQYILLSLSASVSLYMFPCSRQQLTRNNLYTMINRYYFLVSN